LAARFTVGIDLGTSNCAVAAVELTGDARAQTVDLPIRQTVRPGEISAKSLLPSFLYLPAAGEFPEGALWSPSNPRRIAGEFARWQGARVPGRQVASAKSWLCHSGVDRQAPILPWGASGDVERLSPVEAQAELLSHMRAAWDAAHPDAPLAEQEVVLTIPASFDEAARALTLSAAQKAGFDLTRLLLLEEPQAAFYDYTARHRNDLSRALSGVRLVLVVDVGGGTTDFSLVRVAMLPEGPALERLAVGDHLLLGGDNMDGALAHRFEAAALGEGKRLSAGQWSQAVQAARAAKETLLSVGAPDRARLAVAGSGSKLLGATVSAELTRDEVEAAVIEGFFPPVDASATVTTQRTGAVVELGLPFATDPAITRHLVDFLRRHSTAGFKALGEVKGEGLPRPDAILLNGGVFNSPKLAAAIIERVSALWPDQPRIPSLAQDSLDLAVARGAAYSGLARRALGKKIGGGAPRAWYALVGEGQLVCLIPRGQDEGKPVELSRNFKVKLGQPVQFQLYATSSDRIDQPGDVVALSADAFKPLPPIHTVLSGQKGASVDAHLVATLTEVGTLALALVSGAERWRLEFAVRGNEATEGITLTESMPARFAEAVEQVEKVFGTRPLPVGPKDVKSLARTLEQILGERNEWRLPVLRELWTQLIAGAAKRRRSADHERMLYHLLGYALRPGFGYPLDAWRCQQTFALFKDSVTAHQEVAVWAEFWIMWRRIAPGLEAAAQSEIAKYLWPFLEQKVPLNAPEPKTKAKGVQPQGLDEMVRCAASLELLTVAQKEDLGAWICTRLADKDAARGPWAWALGRLGARVPVRGAAHAVVSADTATAWAKVLMQAAQWNIDGAAFALALVSRRTGDRARDLDDETRAQVLAALDTAGGTTSWKIFVRDVVRMSQADESRALGDTLPLGLELAG
jgi:molecular chaperone DnaK (HSP70)